MSVPNLKNQLSRPLVLALLLLSISLQNCAPIAPVSGDSQGEIEPSQALEQIAKIPTKDCLFNNVTYQCVTISYGDHSLQDYELWLPNNPHVSGGLPLVTYIHGGGYYKGDRGDAYNITSGMQELLDLGYAFATVNYRLSGDFPYEKDVTSQYPAEMQDAATALQDLRMRASHYGYDPEKIALTGVSAGSGISLWLAFHDDLKNELSTNPRDHYSTRVNCVAVSDTQTTINIAEVAPLLGANFVLDVGLPGFFGFTPDEYNANPSYYQTRYAASMNEASAISHLSADDNVNLLLTYMMGFGTGNIHSPEFGNYFTKGTPAPLAAQFGRTSMLALNKPFTVKTNQGAKNKINVINHIGGCF